ncbi:NPFFR2 [Branchiostoma lanceolatum]|uniref:NPFFR2 protein n=1 Tax=Branchiostoma lanceolatum TaxID=7740 RepID=A0A8J9YL20_BRALA|nr:NPFFR2 [Branchiostoma lanceolatum]
MNFSNMSSLNVTKTDPDLTAWKHPLAVTCLLTICNIVIFLLCITGNVLICVVVAKNRNMRNVTNYLIVNLAASDLFLGGFCMPFTMLDNLKGGWMFGEVMCKLQPMAQGVAMCASVFTLVAIAVDRYLAVMAPTDEKLSSRVCVVAIVVIWASSIGIMSPIIPMMVYKDYGHVQTCSEGWATWESRRAYTTSILVLCFALPLLVIAALYSRAATQLYLSNARRNRRQNTSGAGLGHKVRVFKMMAVVVVVFTLLYLPLHVLTMLVDFGDLSDVEKRPIYAYGFPVSHWLAFFHTCVNPFVYALLNRNFRKGFRAAFSNNRSSSTSNGCTCTFVWRQRRRQKRTQYVKTPDLSKTRKISDDRSRLPTLLSPTTATTGDGPTRAVRPATLLLTTAVIESPPGPVFTNSTSLSTAASPPTGRIKKKTISNGPYNVSSREVHAAFIMVTSV